jgi:hypothetical protein
MRLARVIILLSLLASVALIVSHLLGLPSYPIRGWIFAPRVKKEAFFSITGDPFDHESWTSRWGRNRPMVDRSHAILSEIEVRVKHQSRSSLVEVSVTGDSEEEVDSFIQTLRSDVERTYSSDEPLALDHGRSRGGLDGSVSTIYWRQRYLWLLIANAVVLFVLWFSVRREKNQIAEHVVGGNGG